MLLNALLELTVSLDLWKQLCVKLELIMLPLTRVPVTTVQALISVPSFTLYQEIKHYPKILFVLLDTCALII